MVILHPIYLIIPLFVDVTAYLLFNAYMYACRFVCTLATSHPFSFSIIIILILIYILNACVYVYGFLPETKVIHSYAFWLGRNVIAGLKFHTV